MSDLAEQIDALLALNAKGAVSHPVPGLAVELLERARNTLSAPPPVDGLEVVAWDVAPKGLPAEPTKSHSFVAEIERQGGSITPLVDLSQASSVIAGMKAERDAAQDSAFTWENRFVFMDGAYNRELSRAQAAEARISSLEKENKRLREAIDAIADFDDPDDSLDPNVIHLIRIAGAARRAARQLDASPCPASQGEHQ
jgi:hypothetical protein